MEKMQIHNKMKRLIDKVVKATYRIQGHFVVTL